MKNSTKTKLILSSLGFLLISGQGLADSFPFHGHNDSGRERIQNTPELQAIHDSQLRPITPGHLAAFDGLVRSTSELQAIHDSMKRPLPTGHIAENSAFDGKSSWFSPDLMI